MAELTVDQCHYGLHQKISKPQKHISHFALGVLWKRDRTDKKNSQTIVVVKQCSFARSILIIFS